MATKPIYPYYPGHAMPSTPPTARFSIAVLENPDGDVLFVRRSPDSRLGPDRWGFPAGHIERGETPCKCMERELREEIGPGHEYELLKTAGPVRDSFYGGNYEIHLFHYAWRRGRIRLNEEHTDFAWVSREDFAGFEVMDGIDEDLYLLDVWPRRFLNAARLPAHLR
jgi:8-oxo-dGTP pyrophosphatase MutT (NUDIX family)